MTGRHALIVANDEYADPELRQLAAPAQDAAALADALADSSLGDFDVRVLHNEPAQQIRLAVEDFFADRTPEDLLLLHFSCHGLKNSAGELFLAVADTRPTRLASTAVAADFVNRQMADSRAQRIALFLDCCYGGAFPRGMVVRAAGEAQVRDAFAGQERVGGGRGRVVVTASSAMEYAFEGDRLATGTAAPSVFTGAVVDGLTTGEADKDGDGWVGLTELVGYVTDRVHRTTPHQTPQMWTFGAQGELLIARSRVRKIVPTPLPPELLKAMDSPLAAVRFGVVDDLRERLHGDDLGQAYAAWQKLQLMADDDSRKVSEAARRWLADATPRASIEALDLGIVESGAAAVGEFRVEGPPLAATAVASAGASWLTVEQQSSTVRVTAAGTAPEDSEADVVLTGPTGATVVPVRVRVVEPEPASPPEPEPALEGEPERTAEAMPEPEPEPPVVSPAPQEAPAPVGATPLWAVAALVLGGLLLVFLNWPSDPGVQAAWDDWISYGELARNWGDPYFIGAVVALTGALGAGVPGPWSRVAWGVAGGSAGFLSVNGALFLATGLVDNDSEIAAWAATVVVAAGMAAIVLAVARPLVRPLRPMPKAGRILLVVGGLTLGLSRVISHDDLGIWNGVALAVSAGVVALTWLALTAARLVSALLLVGAVSAMVVLGVVEAVAVALEDDIGDFLLLTVVGYLLLSAAVGVAVRTLPHGDAAEPPAPTVDAAARPFRTLRWPPWMTAIGLAAGAVLILFVYPGSLDHLEGGRMVAFVPLAAAAAVLGPGRIAAVGLGMAAAAITWVVVVSVVILATAPWAVGEGFEVSLLVALAMLALVGRESARRSRGGFRRPEPRSGLLLIPGFLFVITAQYVREHDYELVSISRGASLLFPLVAAGLALLCLSVIDSTGRLIVLTAAVGYLVPMSMGAVMALTGAWHLQPHILGGSAPTMLVGHVLLLAAVAVDAISRRLQPGQRTPAGSAGPPATPPAVPR